MTKNALYAENMSILHLHHIFTILYCV